MTKKRITVTSETYTKLAEIAMKLDINGSEKEKVEKLFNDNLLLNDYAAVQQGVTNLQDKLLKIEEESCRIDDEQNKRIKKLQALGVLNENFSLAIKELVDVYMDARSDEIKEAVLKI